MVGKKKIKKLVVNLVCGFVIIFIVFKFRVDFVEVVVDILVGKGDDVVVLLVVDVKDVL